MFFIFNKEKIKTYLVSVGTVVILFLFAFVLSKDGTRQTIKTQANIYGINNNENTDNIINDNETID